MSGWDHKLAWELFHEEWRIKFYYFTRRSAEYYLGVPEPPGYTQQHAKNYPDDKIVLLLKASAIKNSFVMTGLNSSGSTNSIISETAIKAVYDFAEYDESWNDPLSDVERFTAGEITRARHRSEGLHVFLYAMRKWSTSGKQVTLRATLNEPRADGSLPHFEDEDEFDDQPPKGEA